ncbi:glycosyltransferase family 39 protein [Candidatus Dojkabacteria bacterium]|uniref:Glycosyltransferase family 39 protein n=1 Tax=Candidatus Dojkabacteria bacterium TaxID=2099670 RepID=A0A955LB49_9BACT|nr:glycosyltransferase family 39 protein [Candidatus Dojkabacteria bacterium]
MSLLKDRGLLSLVVIFFLLLFLFGRPIVNGDGFGYFGIYRTLKTEQSVNTKYPEQFTNFADWTYGHVWDDTYAPLYYHGSAMLWSPFLIVSDLIGETGLLSDFSDDYFNTYGVSIFEGMGILIGTAILSLISFYLIFLILKRYFSENVSLLASFGIFFSNFLFFYTFIEPSNSHLPALSLITVGLWLIHNRIIDLDQKNTYHDLINKLKESEDSNWWILAGLIFGLSANVRIDSILIIAPFIIFLIYKRNLSVFIRVMAGIILGIIPMLIFSNNAYADPFESGLSLFSYEAPFSLKYFSVFKLLFSPIRGILAWSPLVIFSIVGLILGVRRINIIKQISIYGLVTALSVLLFYSFWNNWWAGYSLGNRFFIVLYPVFVFGLANFINQMRLRRLKYLALFIVCIGILFSLTLTLGFVTYDNSNKDAPYYVKFKEPNIPDNYPNLLSEQYDVLDMYKAGVMHLTLNSLEIEFNDGGKSLMQLSR